MHTKYTYIHIFHFLSIFIFNISRKKTQIKASDKTSYFFGRKQIIIHSHKYSDVLFEL